MFKITPVYSNFVAEISEIDLTKTFSNQLSRDLNSALEEYAVLVIPNQSLDEEQQLNVAQAFGPLETSFGAMAYDAKEKRRLHNKHLSDISNIDENNDILDSNDIRHVINVANSLWHTDSSFKETPAYASLLYAQEVVPVGGATEFADTRTAWEELDAHTKQEIDGLIAVHNYFHSRALTGIDLGSIPEAWHKILPPVRQVLVRDQQSTGRKSLYMASHIQSIVGMTKDRSQLLIDKLMSHATQKQYIYRHRWRLNDLVIWDNRTTMHRGTPFDIKYRRSMRRATVQDIGPTVDCSVI